MAAEPLSYEQILRRKLPHSIHDNREADQVRDEIQTLLRKHPRSEGEEDYLSLIEHLLIAWETGRYATPDVPGVDALRCLIEDNGLTQAALVGPVFASPGIVSEILSGKRQLTLNHVKKLAAFFHTSPSIFIS